MRAGSLRERINVEQVTLATADTYGDQAEAWSTILASVPAAITQLSAVEHWKQKSSIPEATHQVKIRHNPDVTSAVRFLWGTRYLYPLSVVADERQRQMTCLCNERL